MKKKKRKITGIVVATLLLGSMLTVNASTNGWVNTGGNWSYLKEDEAKAAGWLQEGNR